MKTLLIRQLNGELRLAEYTGIVQGADFKNYHVVSTRGTRQNMGTAIGAELMGAVPVK